MKHQPERTHRKLMRKVKKQWVAVAVIGSIVGGALMPLNASAWTARSVDEIKGDVGDVTQVSELGDYTLRYGDTLWGLSRATGFTIEDFVESFGIKNRDFIVAGLDLNEQSQVNAKSNTSEFYTVVSGDTLSAIAHRTNTTVGQLADWNNIQNVDLIFPGQVLRVVKAASNTSDVVVEENDVVDDKNTTNETIEEKSNDVDNSSDAEEDEEEVEAPAEPSEDEEEVETPAEPSEDEEEVETPAEPSEDEEEVETPAEPSEDEEEVEAPAEPSEDEEEVEAPAEPSEDEEEVEAPAEPSEDEEEVEAPAEPSEDEEEVEAPTEPSEDEEEVETPAEPSEDEEEEEVEEPTGNVEIGNPTVKFDLSKGYTMFNPLRNVQIEGLEFPVDMYVMENRIFLSHDVGMSGIMVSVPVTGGTIEIFSSIYSSEGEYVSVTIDPIGEMPDGNPTMPEDDEPIEDTGDDIIIEDPSGEEIEEPTEPEAPVEKPEEPETPVEPEEPAEKDEPVEEVPFDEWNDQVKHFAGLVSEGAEYTEISQVNTDRALYEVYFYVTPLDMRNNPAIEEEGLSNFRNRMLDAYVEQLTYEGFSVSEYAYIGDMGFTIGFN